MSGWSYWAIAQFGFSLVTAAYLMYTGYLVYDEYSKLVPGIEWTGEESLNND